MLSVGSRSALDWCVVGSRNIWRLYPVPISAVAPRQLEGYNPFNLYLPMRLYPAKLTGCIPQLITCSPEVSLDSMLWYLLQLENAPRHVPRSRTARFPVAPRNKVDGCIPSRVQRAFSTFHGCIPWRIHTCVDVSRTASDSILHRIKGTCFINSL